jgi:hypothetical protein
MSPEYVRPYVKAQKNDDRDAEGIAEAASRPTMRFVDLKSQGTARSAVFASSPLTPGWGQTHAAEPASGDPAGTWSHLSPRTTQVRGGNRHIGG